MIPHLKSYIWGGRNLETIGKNLPQGKIAEAWEVSVHADGLSVIGNGLWAGTSLKELAEQLPSDILGTDLTSFPLLFKLIDASDDLSVQVHPDDAYAHAHENGQNGKHEAWYILDAAPGARIIYGLSPGIDRQKLLLAIEQSTINSCINSMVVHAGDVVDVRPGMIHAIGKGILLAEIQQNSNLTYRLYDYDRIDINGDKRPLHTVQALDVIDYQISANTVLNKGSVLRMDKNITIIDRLHTEHFAIDELHLNGSTIDYTAGRFVILFFLEGAAQIIYQGGRLSVKMGNTVVVPAVLEQYTMCGACRALKMYVPK